MQDSRTFEEESKYGKKGEDFFEAIEYKIFGTKPYCYNVSGIPIFQLIDVDYIISKKPLNLRGQKEQLKIVQELKHHHIDNIKDADFFTIEVKTDSVIDNTSENFCFELTAHDKPGAFGISRADFWFYVPLKKDEEYDDVVYPSHFWLINMYKMRRYLGENHQEKEKKSGMRFHYWVTKNREWDSHCFNLLANEKILTNKGIAKKYETEKYIG